MNRFLSKYVVASMLCLLGLSMLSFAHMNIFLCKHVVASMLCLLGLAMLSFAKYEHIFVQACCSIDALFAGIGYVVICKI